MTFEAFVVNAEAVFTGGKATKVADLAALEAAQPQAVLEALEHKDLRLASAVKKGSFSFRSAGQYRQKPNGPVLAVTNDHPNRQMSDSFPPVSNDDLALIAQLPAVMAVFLRSAQVSELGVLNKAPFLRHLGLADCHGVSGAQLGQLRGLRHVRVDAPLLEPSAWLAQLPHLERLTIERSPFKLDDLMRDVGALPKLRQLALGTGTYEERHLRQLATGSSLFGVETAVRLPVLEVLDFSDATSVDETGLVHLVKLPSLQRLVMGRNAVSAGVKAKVMAGLPKLKIEMKA